MSSSRLSPDSFIHVDDFPEGHEGLQQLAAYLVHLARNPSVYYAKHHAWRGTMSKAAEYRGKGDDHEADAHLAHFCKLMDTNINTLACRICEKVSAHRDQVVAVDNGAEEEDVVPAMNSKQGKQANSIPALVIGIKGRPQSQSLMPFIDHGSML